MNCLVSRLACSLAFVSLIICAPSARAQSTPFVPSAVITNPVNGATFSAPADITVTANVTIIPRDGNVFRLFAGTNLEAALVLDPCVNCTNVVTMPINLSWNDVPAGVYDLTFEVTDGATGLSGTSAPVEITVGPIIPVVTIRTTQPIATWAGTPGTFTVFRAGDTNATLNVFYDIGGTASNGVDYTEIPSIVNIPAGVTSNTITISPINNGQTNTETVILHLAPSPELNPVNFTIGTPDTAVVFIVGTNANTNLPPIVRISSPPNNAEFYAPVNIPIFAFASDCLGLVTNVEFFAGTNDLGPGRGLSVLPLPGPIPGPVPLASSESMIDPLPPILPLGEFFIVWSNAPLGAYALTAVASDSEGLSSTSLPVNITILPPPPPPTNRPDVLDIFATDPVAVEGTNCWVWPGLTNPVPTWAAWPTAVRYLFTNCGPKDATFSVRRHGDTNDDVTATYSIGGTASNGVDYVTLPGWVTIPAGQREALISIVPIDDGPPDINKTVILTLTPSTNTPPDYILGIHRMAAAIILDGIWPRPWNAMLPDFCFHLGAIGPDGAWFHVDCSTDLVNWLPICTNQVVNGSIDIVDPAAQDGINRFYRTVQENGPPQ